MMKLFYIMQKFLDKILFSTQIFMFCRPYFTLLFKRLKSQIIVFVLLFISYNSTFAQPKKGEQIRALKTAFITQQLQLTTVEAESFWPVYNKHQQEIYALKMQERKEIRHKINTQLEQLNVEQAAAMLKKIQEFRIKENQLHEQLEKNLLELFDAKRLLKLKKAEHDFQLQILKKYRGKDR